MNETAQSFPATERSRVRLMRKRGSNDQALVYEILDAALLCNIGYVIDGQPYVTPTAFWREGNHLYWHGSAASRALGAQSTGVPVCVCVAHVDGLVVARAGFHSSVNYRAVMAFGRAQMVEGVEAKRRAMDVFQDRFTPGRSSTNRVASVKELNQTKVMVMEIEEASAKVRTGAPLDDEEDYALPIWAGTIDFKTVVDMIQADSRNLAGVGLPDGVAKWEKGAAVDQTLARIYDADAVRHD